MKLVVNLDGTIAFDDVSVEDAIQLTDTMRKRAEVAAKDRPPAPDPSMNDANYETWCVLVDNDNENGVHIHHVARVLGISIPAATQRLGIMVKRGTAKRVRIGYYRPLEHM